MTTFLSFVFIISTDNFHRTLYHTVITTTVEETTTKIATTTAEQPTTEPTTTTTVEATTTTVEPTTTLITTTPGMRELLPRIITRMLTLLLHFVMNCASDSQ